MSLIIYNDRQAWRQAAFYPCIISCKKCPFRFKCFTTRDTISVSELEYHDATEIVPGREYLSVVGIGETLWAFIAREYLTKEK